MRISRVSSRVRCWKSDGRNIKDLVAGTRGREAPEKGDPQGGVVAAGLALGLIDDVPGTHTDELLESRRALSRGLHRCPTRATIDPGREGPGK